MQECPHAGTTQIVCRNCTLLRLAATEKSTVETGETNPHPSDVLHPYGTSQGHTA